MTQRSPISVFALTLVTLGIYGVVWEVKTKTEMVSQGADIPTAWLIIVPFANIYWLWKWSQGVEKVTGGQMSGILAFILLYLAGPIGAAIIQDGFNKASAAPMPSMGQPAMPAMPTASAPTPPQNPTPPSAPQPPIQ